MLGVPKLDTMLQEGSHGCRVEGQMCLLFLAGHADFDAALDTVGFLGCTLLGHVELLINQYPQILLLRAVLNPLSTQSVLELEIALTQKQDLALSLVLYDVHWVPGLKAVQVLLVGIPSLQTSHSFVVLANLLKVQSVPLPLSPKKMFKSANPHTDPSGAPWTFHFDIQLFAPSLGVQHSVNSLFH